jgi:transaldolase
VSRHLLQGGGFAELIRDYSVTGATSNPTIFANAITGSDLYDEQLRELVRAGGRDTQELFFSLALDDVREAGKLLRPEYERVSGRDGFISFECTPDLVDDTDATIAQATMLWQRLAQRRLPPRPHRPDARGRAAGADRVGGLLLPFPGLTQFSGAEWERLERTGATRQRPLWASTGTKNTDYSDVLYVEELIGPDVVSTMPDQTLRAFADHGRVARTLDADPLAAQRTLADAARAGVDLGTVTAELEREGVRSFCDSYRQLLDCIESKAGVDARTPTQGGTSRT